jgi:hypothetical protein
MAQEATTAEADPTETSGNGRLRTLPVAGWIDALKVHCGISHRGFSSHGEP